MDSNTPITEYQAPRIVEVGDLVELTAGQFFDRPDGCSGNVGNRGASDPPVCS